jgi:hypothetical protein
VTDLFDERKKKKKLHLKLLPILIFPFSNIIVAASFSVQFFLKILLDSMIF